MELHYLAKNPFQEFHDWFKEAELNGGMDFPNAMSLATVGADGRPGLRTVLLKGVSEAGFTFFTNYKSRKGAELDFNPQAALCFYWDKISRQVRVEGSVEKLSREESEAYFRTRPRLSQIGAWASPQSQEIASRAELEEKVKEISERFRGKDIPLPDFWGGYVLKPDYFEFWQMGEGRLHDRFVYAPSAEGWLVKRLAP
jgi:pyridoxamine 5'-phosphate oxidase